MKKLAIFLAIMLIPFTAFALDTISDNDLNDVTGQAGVSIYTNSIQIVKTGVTTTYTDNDNSGLLGNGAQAVNVVDNGSTTQIYFRGVDPLMIDIINMTSLAVELSAKGLLMSTYDYGETGVMITLPDAIEIVNVNGATKTYYTGAIGAANELISVAVTGGTTRVEHADQTWGTSHSLTMGVFHQDQIAIIITAHADHK
jgi:hypothetical protein